LRHLASAAVVVLAAIAVTAPACRPAGPEAAKTPTASPQSAPRAEASPSPDEEKRRASLAEAIKGVEPPTDDVKARRKFAEMRKASPKKYQADLDAVARCYLEQLRQAQEAAVQKHYAEVAAPASECLLSMEALHDRFVSALLKNMKDPQWVPSERDQGIENALQDLALSNIKRAQAWLLLMIESGPPDVRSATFEAIASGLPADVERASISRTILQSGYALENVGAAKQKMGDRLKALGIPLQPPSPSSSASAKGAP
jgi:hypothetical protein